MKRLIGLFLSAALLLAGCADRNNPPAPASAPESAASSVPESLPSQPAPPPKPESEPEPETEEQYPLPPLAESELALLAEELEVFITHVGGANLKDASLLEPEKVLAAALDEINRTRDMHGYFFTKNTKGQELVSEELVQETALRMFGLEKLPQLDSYDPDTKCYPYAPAVTDRPAHTVAGPVGAPDDALAYTVSFEASGVSYLFTCTITRMNSIPYLRLESVARINE